MAAPTLSSVRPRLHRREAALAKLDGGPGPASGPSTWKAWELRDEAATARLEAYKPPVAGPAPGPTKPPSPLSVNPTLSIIAPEVLPGERVAKVHVRLSEPSRRPMTWSFYTANATGGGVSGGTVTNGTGAAFQSMSQRFVMMTGETEKVFDVPLGKDLQPGAFFKVGVGAPTMQPNSPGGAETVVKGATVKTPVPPNPHPAPVYAPAVLQGSRSLVYETDFLGPVSPNKVPGQWRTREPWGRWRNKELAPNCDATTDPGTNPHPIETVDGKDRRILRAGYLPGGVLQDIGAPTPGVFDFWGAELWSGDVYTFPVGGAMHLRFKSGRAQGSTLAVWFVAQAGEYFEIDVVENGLGFDARGPLDNFASTVHGYFGAEGVGLEKPLNDGNWHDLWYEETGGEMITSLDGNVLVRRPNPYPYRPRLPFIVNVSVGGITDAPRNVSPGWKSDMILDRVRFYE